jgi:hypothetical protein
MRLPASERLRELVASHRELGVRGVRVRRARSLQGVTLLSLIPSGTLRIHLLAPDGNPIRSLELGVNIRANDSHGTVAGKIEAAHVRTDAGGKSPVPWAPREKLESVESRTTGSEWRIDGTDRGRISARILTVHARRGVPVEGRLVMPMGASPVRAPDHGIWLRPREYGGRPSLAESPRSELGSLFWG